MQWKVRRRIILPGLIVMLFGCRKSVESVAEPAIHQTIPEFFRCKREDIQFIRQHATRVPRSPHGPVTCEGNISFQDHVLEFVSVSEVEKNSLSPGLEAACTEGGAMSIPGFGEVSWKQRDSLTLRFRKDGGQGPEEIAYFVPKAWISSAGKK